MAVERFPAQAAELTKPIEAAGHTSVAGRYFESPKPLELSGERKGIEVRGQRLGYYVRMRLPTVAAALRDVGSLPTNP